MKIFNDYSNCLEIFQTNIIYYLHHYITYNRREISKPFTFVYTSPKWERSNNIIPFDDSAKMAKCGTLRDRSCSTRGGCDVTALPMSRLYDITNDRPIYIFFSPHLFFFAAVLSYIADIVYVILKQEIASADSY